MMARAFSAAIVAVAFAGAAVAQEFRVETEVFVGDEPEPLEKSNTHRQRASDYRLTTTDLIYHRSKQAHPSQIHPSGQACQAAAPAPAVDQA